MKDQAIRIQGRTESGEEVVSGCCPPKSDASDGFRKIKATICPACSTRGKPVRTITVKSLVRDHTQVPLDVNFFFCDASNCRVVYFSEGPVFLKADLKIRVGFKEQENPFPLYYS